MTVPAVHLWDGIQDPYLYQARARLYREGQVVDEISSRFGFRSFSVDPQKGFFLNGRSYPLRGVSRHQAGRASEMLLTERITKRIWI